MAINLLRLVLLLILLIPTGHAARADVLDPLKGLFSSDDEGVVIWSDGPDQYVKVVEQDRFKRYERPPRNEHPAKLNPADLAIVLASFKTKSAVQLIRPDKAALLSTKLVDAVSRIRNRDDVIFSIVDEYNTTKGSKRLLVAGRMFVNKDGLNVIFGPMLRPLPVEDFRPGRRKEREFPEAAVASGPGITYWGEKRFPREDWLIVDVPTVVAAYKGPKMPEAVQEKTVAAAAAPTATAVSGEEIQLREELARERKRRAEMEKALEIKSAVPEKECEAKDYKQRLAIIKELYDEKLISDEEYAAKRRKILDEI